MLRWCIANLRVGGAVLVLVSVFVVGGSVSVAVVLVLCLVGQARLLSALGVPSPCPGRDRQAGLPRACAAPPSVVVWRLLLPCSSFFLVRWFFLRGGLRLPARFRVLSLWFTLAVRCFVVPRRFWLHAAPCPSSWFVLLGDAAPLLRFSCLVSACLLLRSFWHVGGRGCSLLRPPPLLPPFVFRGCRCPAPCCPLSSLCLFGPGRPFALSFRLMVPLPHLPPAPCLALFRGCRHPCCLVLCPAACCFVPCTVPCCAVSIGPPCVALCRLVLLWAAVSCVVFFGAVWCRGVWSGAVCPVLPCCLVFCCAFGCGVLLRFALLFALCPAVLSWSAFLCAGLCLLALCCAVLRLVVPCLAVLFYTVLSAWCCAAFSRTFRCCVLLCRALRCCRLCCVLCCAMLCCRVLCCALACGILLRCAVLFALCLAVLSGFVFLRVLLCLLAPCCAVLRLVVLCGTVLLCTVLSAWCCAAFSRAFKCCFVLSCALNCCVRCCVLCYVVLCCCVFCCALRCGVLVRFAVLVGLCPAVLSLSVFCVLCSVSPCYAALPCILWSLQCSAVVPCAGVLLCCFFSRFLALLRAVPCPRVLCRAVGCCAASCSAVLCALCCMCFAVVVWCVLLFAAVRFAAGALWCHAVCAVTSVHCQKRKKTVSSRVHPVLPACNTITH